MRQKYLISLAIPVYGVEKYIERCARSLFEQTYDNIEYIFVNDCTKDNSMEILRRTMQDYPLRIPQVRIIKHECNRGLACARNTAVSSATGDFIMHIDSDDYVAPDIVERCVEKQFCTNADIVSCNYLKYYAGYSKKRKNKAHVSAKEHCLAVIRREDLGCIFGRLIRISLYRDYAIMAVEDINVCEDYQVCTKLIYHANKTVVVNDPLYHYDYTNTKSYSHQFTINEQRQWWKSFDIIENYFSDKGNEFIEALVYAKLKIIVIHLIISGKTSNGLCFYKESLKRLKEIERKYWNIEPFSRRMVLYLSFNYSVMRAYIRLSRWANRILKQSRHSFY